MEQRRSATGVHFAAANQLLDALEELELLLRSHLLSVETNGDHQNQMFLIA